MDFALRLGFDAVPANLDAAVILRLGDNLVAKDKAEYQELLVGLVRLHVLHQAAISKVFGLAIIGELSSRGYRLGPGTIYPLLRSMERRGWLRSEVVHSVGGRRRICYSATRAGRIALEKARVKLHELHEELFSSQAL